MSVAVTHGRLVELAVVGSIDLESPLITEDEIVYSPFDTIYRKFTTLHTVSGETANLRSNPLGVFSPNGRRHRSSSKRISGHSVPSAVVDTLHNFCFPNGEKVLQKRPPFSASSSHCFVIHESGHYGCCVTFYREVDSRAFWLAYECVKPRNTDSAKQSEETTNDRTNTIFVPTSVCLVSRSPYIGVLKQALTLVYPRLSGSAVKVDVVLEELMADLSCIPAPSAGPYELYFPLRVKDATNNSTKMQYLRCSPPPHTGLPVLDISPRLLFLMIKPEDILLIITALLTEQRIVFVSRDWALLTPVIEGLLALIYPFTWRHVYIPLVPALMLTVVAAPVPFLFGINAEHASQIENEVTDPPIVVELDNRTVHVPSTVTLPNMPDKIRKNFLKRVSNLSWDFDIECAGSVMFQPEYNAGARKAHADRLVFDTREIFLNLMLELFGEVRNFMMFDLAPPVFSAEKYFDKFPKTDHDFFRAVFPTSTFRAFQRSRNAKNLDYFDRRAGDMTQVLTFTPRPKITFPPTTLELNAEENVIIEGRISTRSGSPVHRRKFTDETIDMLNKTLGATKDVDLKTQLLLLRATLNAWQGSLEQALDDFEEVTRINQPALPCKLIHDMIMVQPLPIRDRLTKQGWSGVLNCLGGNEEQPVARFISSGRSSPNPQSTVQLPEVGIEEEVLAAIRKGTGINESSFVAVCKVLGITDDASQASSLFSALATTEKSDMKTEDDDTEMDISVNIFVQFWETWNGIEDLTVDPLQGLVALDSDETVVKVLPLVLISNVLGTLVMTHKRLFIVPNNEKSSVQELCKLESILNIQKFQYKVFIPPGVPALRIIAAMKRQQADNLITNPAKRKSSSTSSNGGKTRRGSSFAAEDTMVAGELTLLLWSERDSWYGYIKEMVEAHKAKKDIPSALVRAAKNIDLAEAVWKISVSGSGSKRLAPGIESLLPFSHPPIPLEPILEREGNQIVKKIDLMPDVANKATVEALLFIPGPGADASGSLWCGLGSGAIQVLEMPTTIFEPRIHYHQHRITDLLLVGDTVWSASFDASICIMDVRSRKLVHRLENLGDPLSCLLLTNSNSGSTVWVGTLGGSLLEFDSTDYTFKRSLVLPQYGDRIQSVTSCALMNNALWCATGLSIIIFDLESGEIQNKEMSLQGAHSLVAGNPGEIWSCSNIQGIVLVWNAEEYDLVQCGGKWMIDCGGFNSLLRSENAIWGAANNGSVYVWDPESRNLIKELTSHSDAVRSICLMGPDLVVTGSASRDGTAIVWHVS
eukprot:m.86082 g.86082  ORF g.86082 m.86082 type:complete len:1268 (+) comp13043_c0_seq3:704-4507(+)